MLNSRFTHYSISKAGKSLNPTLRFYFQHVANLTERALYRNVGKTNMAFDPTIRIALIFISSSVNFVLLLRPVILNDSSKVVRCFK